MSLDDFLILSRDSSDISLCDSDSESELEDAVLLHRRAAQSNLITSTISDGEDGNDEALLHAILEGSCSHGDLCVNNVVTAVGPVTRPVSDQSDKHFTPSPTEVSALRWLNPTISSFLLPSAARSVTIPAHSDVELDILEEGAPQLLEEERNLFAERLLNAGENISLLETKLRQTSSAHNATKALLNQLLEAQLQQQPNEGDECLSNCQQDEANAGLNRFPPFIRNLALPDSRHAIKVAILVASVLLTSMLLMRAPSFPTPAAHNEGRTSEGSSIEDLSNLQDSQRPGVMNGDMHCSFDNFANGYLSADFGLETRNDSIAPATRPSLNLWLPRTSNPRTLKSQRHSPFKRLHIRLQASETTRVKLTQQLLELRSEVLELRKTLAFATKSFASQHLNFAGSVSCMPHSNGSSIMTLRPTAVSGSWSLPSNAVSNHKQRGWARVTRRYTSLQSSGGSLIHGVPPHSLLSLETALPVSSTNVSLPSSKKTRHAVAQIDDICFLCSLFQQAHNSHPLNSSVNPRRHALLPSNDVYDLCTDTEPHRKTFMRDVFFPIQAPVFRPQSTVPALIVPNMLTKRISTQTPRVKDLAITIPVRPLISSLSISPQILASFGRLMSSPASAWLKNDKLGISATAAAKAVMIWGGSFLIKTPHLTPSTERVYSLGSNATSWSASSLNLLQSVPTFNPPSKGVEKNMAVFPWTGHREPRQNTLFHLPTTVNYTIFGLDKKIGESIAALMRERIVAPSTVVSTLVSVPTLSAEKARKAFHLPIRGQSVSSELGLGSEDVQGSTSGPSRRPSWLQNTRLNAVALWHHANLTKRACDAWNNSSIGWISSAGAALPVWKDRAHRASLWTGLFNSTPTVRASMESLRQQYTKWLNSTLAHKKLRRSFGGDRSCILAPSWLSAGIKHIMIKSHRTEGAVLGNKSQTIIDCLDLKKSPVKVVPDVYHVPAVNTSTSTALIPAWISNPNTAYSNIRKTGVLILKQNSIPSFLRRTSPLSTAQGPPHGEGHGHPTTSIISFHEGLIGKFAWGKKDQMKFHSLPLKVPLKRIEQYRPPRYQFRSGYP